MKQITILSLMALLAVPMALAGGMVGHYGYSGWGVFLQLILCLLFVFIASIIFWWTYLWMVEDKGKLIMKKKK